MWTASLVQEQQSTDAVTSPSKFKLDKLNQVLDFANCGVPKHLGLIAESMDEWGGIVADELGLSRADVNNINHKCFDKGSKVRW